MIKCSYDVESYFMCQFQQMEGEIVCIICNKNGTIENSCALTEKGTVGLNRASRERQSDLIAIAGQYVHVKCRQNFTNSKSITLHCQKLVNNKSSSSTSQATRRSQSYFNFREHCLFCGTEDKYNGKKRGYNIYPVRTVDFQVNIERICKERDDEWAHVVLGRIQSANDLHAADAFYHQDCSVHFRTGKHIPALFRITSDENNNECKRGKQKNEEKYEAFCTVMSYFEQNDDEQITVTDLSDKMKSVLDEAGIDDEPYSVKYMWMKIREHFSDKVMITEINGKPNVVTLRDNAANILHNFYNKTRKTDVVEDKNQLIETVAKLLKSDIKTANTDGRQYPNFESLTDESALSYLPHSLFWFLKHLFAGKR